MNEPKATLATRARSLMRRCDSGTLATHSRSHPGYPFASLAAFAVDQDACPVMLVSRLAEHSRNLASDSRASLLVQRASNNPQADARATLIADAAQIFPDAEFLERYVRQVPGARDLLELGDFFFIRLQPVAIRFIGGFGAVRWVDPADYAPPPSRIPNVEGELIDSLAVSHASQVRSLAQRTLGRDVDDARLIGIDGEGIDVRAEGARLRFDFAAPVSEPARAAEAIMALAESGE